MTETVVSGKYNLISRFIADTGLQSLPPPCFIPYVINRIITCRGRCKEVFTIKMGFLLRDAPVQLGTYEVTRAVPAI